MNLKGKVIDFLGDSITEGRGVSDIPNNRYDNALKHLACLGKVNNFGIGGTRIAHQIHSSQKPKRDLLFCGRAAFLSQDADIIIVFGGTNDYGHGDCPFGEPNDDTPNTFIGAVEFLMSYLKTNYPNATVVFMTPARRKDDLFPSTHSAVRTGNYILKDFVDVILEKGKKYAIPVLDLYTNLGIDPNNNDDFEKYTVDGLHFNDAGHRLIAEKLFDFLKSL